jgi:hypothetical protein
MTEFDRWADGDSSDDDGAVGAPVYLSCYCYCKTKDREWTAARDGHGQPRARQTSVGRAVASSSACRARAAVTMSLGMTLGCIDAWPLNFADQSGARRRGGG